MTRSLCIILVGMLASGGYAFNVNFTVNTGTGQKPISPYIYGMSIFGSDLTTTPGINSAADEVPFTVKRAGGNNTTAWNWENNASNGGNDNGNSNSNWNVAGSSNRLWATPGLYITNLVDHCNARGAAVLLTVPMAGYVAADFAGTVTSSPPSSRWKAVVVNKGSAYENPPNTTDSNVYMDEMMNFIITKYGNASTPTGIKFYDLDNECDVWPITHPLMHPAKVTCNEVITKSIQTAAMIKRMDPYAMVCGPVLCCFYGYYGLYGATDWASVKGTHQWFVSWYLDQMKRAEDSLHTLGTLAANSHLLDILDLHTYPAGDISSYQACVQQPRSLWDPKYVETSWITTSGFRSYLPYLPLIASNITQYYPTVRFGTTEWSYLQNWSDNVAGALATADALGVYGKYSVYLATCWGWSSGYNTCAWNIYRNYDGNKSTFGDTSVTSYMSDTANTSIYASTKGTDLHIVVINKNQTDSLIGTFNVIAGQSYTTGDVWQWNSTTPVIKKLTTGVTLAGNTFTFSAPMQSVSHIVFKGPVAVRQGIRVGNAGTRASAWYLPKLKQLHYSVPGNDVADIAITDGSGKLRLKVSGVSGTGLLPMAKAMHSTGVYLVTISSNNHMEKQRVVVAE